MSLNLAVPLHGPPGNVFLLGDVFVMPEGGTQMMPKKPVLQVRLSW